MSINSGNYNSSNDELHNVLRLDSLTRSKSKKEKSKERKVCEEVFHGMNKSESLPALPLKKRISLQNSTNQGQTDTESLPSNSSNDSSTLRLTGIVKPKQSGGLSLEIEPRRDNERSLGLEMQISPDFSRRAFSKESLSEGSLFSEFSETASDESIAHDSTSKESSDLSLLMSDDHLSELNLEMDLYSDERSFSYSPARSVDKHTRSEIVDLGYVEPTTHKFFRDLGAVKKESLAFVHSVAQTFFYLLHQNGVRQLDQSLDIQAQLLPGEDAEVSKSKNSQKETRTRALSFDSNSSEHFDEIHHFSATPFVFKDQQTVVLVDHISEIGKGSFNKVHPAIVGDEVFVVTRPYRGMKFYERQEGENFLTGAQIVERMCSLRDTPNVVAPHMVVAVKEGELSGGLLFTAMDKGTYLDLFRKEMTPHLMAFDNVTFKRAVSLLTDAANGLKGIHEKKLMHGDCKPANLMAKTTDDGKEEGGVADLEGLSVPMFTNHMRTVKYLSPQTLAAALEPLEDLSYDWRKDDVWSFGLTCLELIAGVGVDDFYKTLNAPLGDTFVFYGSNMLSKPELQDDINAIIEKNIPKNMPHAQELKELLRSAICVDGSDRADMAEIHQRLTSLLRRS